MFAAKRDLTARGFAVLVALSAAVSLAHSLVWLLMTPPLRAPDEGAHLNSTIRLEYGGGWPEPQQAFYGPWIDAAESEAAFGTQLPGTVRDKGEGEFNEAFPPAAYTAITADNALPDGSEAEVDQQSQHPPGYYLVQAGIAKVVGLDGDSWYERMYVQRLLNALLLPLAAVLAAFAAREIVGSRLAGATASFALLAIPQFFHIGTSVTNDTSTTVLGFAVTWLTARALRRGLATRGAVALGAVLGLAMFTKGLALVLVPAVAVAMLLLPATAWRARLLRLVTVGGTALVAGGWWWFANLIRFGNLQPSGMVRGGAKEHDDGLIEFIARIPKQAMQTFWARYGYLDIAIPYYEALGLTAALALMVLIGVIIVRRGWRMSAVMVFLLVTVMVSWLGRVYIFFMKYHGTAGLQGRYVYVAVAAALALAAAPAALVWWRGAFARAFTTMTIVGATALSLYGLDMALSGFYAPPPGSSDTAYDLWSRWSPLGDATLGTSWVLVGFAVAAALAAIVVAWRVRLDPVQTPVAATEQEGVPA